MLLFVILGLNLLEFGAKSVNFKNGPEDSNAKSESVGRGRGTKVLVPAALLNWRYTVLLDIPFLILGPLYLYM